MNALSLPDLLLYRDALMLVLNKPAGIAVHKGRGAGDNLDAYMEQLRFGLPRLPALAHRLDRDTSGCLVLGRNTHALATMGKLFAAGKVQKTYWAVVEGAPPGNEGEIDLPLEKRTSDSRNWHMKLAEEGGMPALTCYRVLARSGTRSWLELTPKTGRTHQLRVHCAALGCPIAGDRIYGKADVFPLMLHARSISLPLYPKKPAITVEAPEPGHMKALFESYSWHTAGAMP